MEYYVIYDFGRICIRKSIGGLNKIEEMNCYFYFVRLFYKDGYSYVRKCFRYK